MPGAGVLGVSPEELSAWAQGYLAGWDRADAAAGRDLPHEEPVKLHLVRGIERAGRRQLWDLMVMAGEYPDPEEIERRLWTHPTTSG
ncbi:MAG TPA: hypothetical protein VF092_16050 [Longimicrobium sp.]